MLTLAEHVVELKPLLEQLEALVSADASAPIDGHLFEWRIRARIIEEKLQTVVRPPSVPDPEEAVEEMSRPVFSKHEMAQAYQALPHANSLREAVQNRRLKPALYAARAVHAAIS